MSIFVTTMYRYGDREKHSYVLGVWPSSVVAMQAGQTEALWRGGKYEPEVTEWRKVDASEMVRFNVMPEKNYKNFENWAKNKGILVDKENGVYKSLETRAYFDVWCAAQQSTQSDKCPVCYGDGWVTNALDGKENCIACDATGTRK